jgi:hypothetical protein
VTPKEADEILTQLQAATLGVLAVYLLHLLAPHLLPPPPGASQLIAPSAPTRPTRWPSRRLAWRNRRSPSAA